MGHGEDGSSCLRRCGEQLQAPTEGELAPTKGELAPTKGELAPTEGEVLKPVAGSSK